MMHRNFPCRQSVDVLLFIVGLLFVVLACGLLVGHTKLFGLKRDSAVMVGTTLPELKSSVALLEANIEAEKLFMEDALASREELADVYILPDTSPGPRVVEVLTELAQALTNSGKRVSVERVMFHAAPKDTDGLKAYSAECTLRGDFQSVSSFLGLLGFSGDMMMKDVLTKEAQDSFLETVETIAPLSLKYTEDFLYLDLLAYAADPESRENRLLKDVPAESMPDLKAILLRGGLSDVRMAFSKVAPALHRKNVWPLPLLTIDRAVRSGETWKVQFMVYGR